MWFCGIWKLHVMAVCIFSGAVVTEFKGDVSSVISTVCVPSTCSRVPYLKIFLTGSINDCETSLDPRKLLQQVFLHLCFPVPDTVEEEGEDDDDDDVTADPMPTTGESRPDAKTYPFQPTEDDVLPTTPDFPVQSTTADGIPSVPTVHFASSSEDTPRPHTTAEATKPPSAPPTTLVTLINKISPDTREEEKEQEKEEEEKLNETPHKEEKDVKRVIGSIINKDSSAVQNSAGSMSSPSVLLACLTGILIVRL